MSSTPSLIPLTTRASAEDLSSALNQREVKAWAPIVGGGALFLYGLSRKSLFGLILASIGGMIAYRGLVPQPTMMRTGAATTISRPPEQLYSFWRDLENLPRIMANIDAIDEISETRSHWTARSVGGAPIEWDAEIIEDEPNRRISWRSDENSEIKTNGVIEFKPAPGNRGTEVLLTLEYSLPMGTLGAVDMAFMGQEPSQQARSDLQRFKQYMETGEVSTTEGQPAGERGRAPEPEMAAGLINNILEGINIIRTGGRATRSRAGTQA